MGEFKGSDPAATGKSTQWPKGVSGNPAGRPRHKHITEIFNELLEDGLTRDEIKGSVKKILLSGKMGAVILLKDMADRTEGKVAQQIEHSGEVNLTLSERMKKARERREQQTKK